MNTDTRPLLATRSEIYLRPSSLATGSAICDFCHRGSQEQPCDLAPMVERCGHFVPALAFVSAEGLEAGFSTYRGSSIWYDRARVIYRTHKTFGLITTKGERIGTAKLVDAHRGTFDTLMREHAYTNHLMINRGLTKEEAAKALTHWIKNHMGSRYVSNPDAVGTVLYLERISGE